MIAVAATAVGIPFDMAMPQLTDVLPNSLGWVVTVFVVGAITTFIAMFGFDQVSKFAMVAAPWMIMIFIAAALAVLPRLGVTEVGSFGLLLKAPFGQACLWKVKVNLGFGIFCSLHGFVTWPCT